MIIALLVGMILGFVLAIPPGPIGVMSVKYTLDSGYRKNVEYSLGTAGMDMVFSLIAIFTASALESYLTRISTSYNQIYFLLFQITVVIGLIVFGILVLKNNKKKIKENPYSKNIKKSDTLQRFKERGAFVFGIAFALTNLANPTFLPFLAFLSIQIHKLDIIHNTFYHNLLFGLGFGIGNFIWLNLLSRLIIKYKSKMSGHTVGFINKFAGITFISFAGILIYRVLTVTKWPEIFRFAF